MDVMDLFHGDKASLKSMERKLIDKVEKINGMKYDKSRKANSAEMVKELKKVDIICGAIQKDTGKICTQKPYVKEDGTSNGRCSKHGGGTSGAVTEEGRKKALANLDPRARMVAGLYSHFVMTQEEADFYYTMLDHYTIEYDLDPINVVALDRMLRNTILNQRKERAEANEIINGVAFDIDYDSKIVKYTQLLGFDRKFNVSKDHKDNQAPVDIAVLLAGEDSE